MDNLTFISELVKATAWPIAFTILSLFLLKKSSFDNIKNIFSLIENRNIRAKFGSAEIELGKTENEKLRSQIREVAKEINPEKRLEIAQKALSVESSIKEITKKDYEYLLECKKNSVNFIGSWQGGMPKEEMSSYMNLLKMGLIQGFDSTGTESIDWITPLGGDVLKALETVHNKSIKRAVDTSVDIAKWYLPLKTALCIIEKEIFIKE